MRLISKKANLPVNQLKIETMDLTRGKISHHIKDIAVPAALGFFFNTMFNIVDTYFAGWISTTALAALTLSFPVFFIILAFVQGIATGSSALISNYLGSHDIVRAERISAQILSFAACCYFFVAFIGLYVDRFLFQLMGAHGEYLEMAVAYMDVIFIGSFFFIALYAANAMLLARGNSRVLRNFLVVGCLINAALDPWFLFGGFGIPAMGLRGIALATVLTMVLGFIYVLYNVIKGGYLRICTWKDFIPKAEPFYEIALQSFPAALNMMTIGTGIFVMTYFIKDFGEAAIAAYGIGIRIEQLTLLPTIGLTVASLAIVGQNNGAHYYERIEETLTISVKYGGLIVLIGAFFMVLMPSIFFKIFTQDPEVISIGSLYLRVAAFISGGYMLLGVYVSALQGMKRPFFPLLIGLFRQILFPICIFYYLVKVLNFGLLSVWISLFFIVWIAAIITVFFTNHAIEKKIKENQN